MYCLCVNVYCTTATGCQPNCTYQTYHIIQYHIDHLSYPGPGQCSLDWEFTNNISNSHQVMFFVDICGEKASVTKVGKLCNISGILTR